MSASIKNPENEAEHPSPMPQQGSKLPATKGPDAQGNDRGERKQDPEGQQGGTGGGSRK